MPRSRAARWPSAPGQRSQAHAAVPLMVSSVTRSVGDPVADRDALAILTAPWAAHGEN